MKKTIITISVIAGLVAVGWYVISRKAAPANPLETETIIVGTSADYPPFSFIKDDEITGFEIDVAKEIINRLGKKIQIKDVPFATLIPELKNGTIHIIAAGLTPSPERERRVSFTRPHLMYDPLVIVTLAKNKIGTLQDLQDKTVVVNEGYMADTFMTEWGRAHLLRLSSPADAFLALKSDRAYAYVDARTSMIPFLEQYGQENFVLTIIPNISSVIALGISPQQQEFKQKIQDALDAMYADGTLDALQKKWNLI